MRRRSLVPLAALLLAPAVAVRSAAAQFAAPRVYAIAGCDYRFADVFGPGPRLCGSGTLSVYDPAPGSLGHQTIMEYAFNLVGYTGFVNGPRGGGGNGFFFAPFGVNPEDAGDTGLSTCLETVCRGFVAGLSGSTFGARTVAGYVPTDLFVRVRYYGADAPTGYGTDGGRYGPGVEAALDLAVVPEPATFALVAGGLAVLGAAGTRRRRAS